MNDRADPRDEALAIFASSHPGREREALRSGLAWYRKTHGAECTNPAAYFGRWSTDDLAARIRLAPVAAPPCPDCGNSGWLEDPNTGRPLRKCTHPRRAVA
jgi:hypothetical protein